VQTVTARYHIESSWAAVFELNIDADSISTNGSDAVAEDDLDLVCENIEDAFCEIASQQAKEMIRKSASKNFGLESARRAPAVIHKFHAVDEINNRPQLRNEVHSLSEIKSNSPKIDHVAAFTETALHARLALL